MMKKMKTQLKMNRSKIKFVNFRIEKVKYTKNMILKIKRFKKLFFSIVAINEPELHNKF